MKQATYMLVFCLCTCVVQSQIKLGSNIEIVHPYSLLELESDRQGLLLVRMDTATRDAAFSLLTPPAGLLIFNTDSQSMELYREVPETGSSGWVSVDAGLDPEKLEQLEALIAQQGVALATLVTDLGHTRQSLLAVEARVVSHTIDLETAHTVLGLLSADFEQQVESVAALETDVAALKTQLPHNTAVSESMWIYRHGSWAPLPPGAVGELLQVSNTGELKWVAPPTSTAAVSNVLSDTDHDTYVEVEGTPDQDQIHFHTRGEERVTVTELGNVGIGTSTPHSTALLELQSNNQGVLFPRLTREALANLVATVTPGLQVYCIDCAVPGFYGFVVDRFVNLVDGTLFNAPTTIGTVTSATGRVWLDRNLGADRVATTSTDALGYGSYYQWGRGTDGHENPSSVTTSTRAASSMPGHAQFIKATSSPNDWLLVQDNSLWQTTDPCPTGFRVPTEDEWRTERDSWSANNAAGAFGSALKLPLAGYRHRQSGTLTDPGTTGRYWSSTTNGANVRRLSVTLSSGSIANISRAYGYCIRCIAK